MDPTASSFSVASVTVAYNNKKALEKCLRALCLQMRPLDAIIIIDNASEDGALEFLRSLGYFGNKKIDYLRLKHNTGSEGGFNAGLKRALSAGFDYIWAIEQDVVPAKDALLRLLESAREQPQKKRIFASCALVPDGTHFFEPVSVILAGKKFSATQSYEELCKIGELVEGHGAQWTGILFPKNALLEAGLPDPLYFTHGGSWEFFERLRKHGFRLYYHAASIVYHPTTIIKVVSVPIWSPKEKKFFIAKFFLHNFSPPWKHYYIFRNMVYMDIIGRKTKNESMAFVLLKLGLYYSFWAFLTGFMNRARRPQVFYYSFLGVFDGLRENMKKEGEL